MRFTRRVVIAVVLAVSTVVPAQAAPHAAGEYEHHYQEVVIGPLPGFPDSAANAVNDRGQVVGHSWTPWENGHAMLWQHGELTDLGAFQPDDRSEAYDINEHGDVAGVSMVGGAYHATLWRNGQMLDIGTLGVGSEAYAINDRGQVVGSWQTEDGDARGFLWERGRMRDLGLPPGYLGVDINDRGVVLVATMLQPPGGVLWRGHVLAEIEAMSVNGLNNRGQVIGMQELPPGGPVEPQAFLWRDGVTSVLPALPGATRTAVGEINDRGDILWGVINEHVQPWDVQLVMRHNGRMTDLEPYGVPDDLSIVGMSNNRWLAGFRADPVDGHLYAVVYR